MLDDIGSIIRFHRKKSGLTQLQLANLAGIGKAAIYDMEHGTKRSRIDTLVKVLKILNIEIRLQSPLMAVYEEQKHEARQNTGTK